MKAVDVLARIDPLGHALAVDVRRQRQLHQDAVHRRVGVERVDEREELGFRGRPPEDRARTTACRPRRSSAACCARRRATRDRRRHARPRDRAAAFRRSCARATCALISSRKAIGARLAVDDAGGHVIGGRAMRISGRFEAREINPSLSADHFAGCTSLVRCGVPNGTMRDDRRRDARGDARAPRARARAAAPPASPLCVDERRRRLARRCARAPAWPPVRRLRMRDERPSFRRRTRRRSAAHRALERVARTLAGRGSPHRVARRALRSRPRNSGHRRGSCSSARPRATSAFAPMRRTSMVSSAAATARRCGSRGAARRSRSTPACSTIWSAAASPRDSRSPRP